MRLSLRRARACGYHGEAGGASLGRRERGTEPPRFFPQRNDQVSTRDRNCQQPRPYVELLGILRQGTQTWSLLSQETYIRMKCIETAFILETPLY